MTVGEPRTANRRGVAVSLANALARQGQSVLLLDEARPDRLRRWRPGTSPGVSDAVLPLTASPQSLGELLAAQGNVPLNVVLVDALGAADGQLSALAAQAHDALTVLAGNDPGGAALTAAYAGIKQLHGRHPGMFHRVVVTDCDVESRAYGVFCRLATVAARYLTVRLSFVGYVPVSTDTTAAAVQRAYDRMAVNLPLWTR